MPIKQVLLYQANDGTYCPTEDSAKERNGKIALKEHLTKKYGKDGRASIEDIVKDFYDYWLIYMKGQEEEKEIVRPQSPE